MRYTETYFGLEDLTAENWKNCGEFEDLVTDVENWLGHELTEPEKKDLVSLYLYHVKGY